MSVSAPGSDRRPVGLAPIDRPVLQKAGQPHGMVLSVKPCAVAATPPQRSPGGPGRRRLRHRLQWAADGTSLYRALEVFRQYGLRVRIECLADEVFRDACPSAQVRQDTGVVYVPVVSPECGQDFEGEAVRVMANCLGQDKEARRFSRGPTWWTGSAITGMSSRRPQRASSA